MSMDVLTGSPGQTDTQSRVARPRTLRQTAFALGLGILTLLGSGLAVYGSAQASPDGAYAQQEVHVDPGNGFGGGTIHYPVNAQGKLPAVVIAPAMSAGKGFYEWNAAKLATYGFVAFAMDTNDPNDFFTQRRDELLAAADYLITASPVRDTVDGTRVAVEGHSASAVGALLAGVQRPSLKVVIALAPVGAGIGPNDVTSLRVPSLLVCGADDGWAPPSQCQGLADAMPQDVPRSVVPVPGAGHGFATGDDDVAFPSELTWLQQYLGG